MVLFNLLGTAGNFEYSLDNWTGGGASVAQDAGSAYIGVNGLLVTNIIAGSFYAERRVSPLTDGKYYLFLAYIKNVYGGPTAQVKWRFNNTNLGGTLNIGKAGSTVPTGTSGTSYVVVNPSEFVAAQALTSTFSHTRIGTESGSIGQSLSVDAVRMYEIDAATAAKVGVDPAYTGENLAALYPYIDTVMEGPEQPLNNLLQTFGSFDTVGSWSGGRAVADKWGAQNSGSLQGATPTLEPTTTGKYAQRISSTASDIGTQRFLQSLTSDWGVTLTEGKCYLYLCDVLLDGVGGRGNIYLINGAGNVVLASSNLPTDVSQTHYVKWKATSTQAVRPRIINWSPLGYVGWVQFDNARLYEVSQSVYDAIDSDPYYTGAYLVDKYPYRDRALSGYTKPSKVWTDKDNFNAPDMNAIEKDTQSLETYLRSLQYAIPPLTSVTDRTAATLETFDSFNRFEGNIEAIKNNFVTPPGYISTKYWGVGVGLDYNDPNRWQTNLQALFDQAVNVEKSFVYSGMATSGAFMIRAGYTPEVGQATPINQSDAIILVYDTFNRNDSSSLSAPWVSAVGTIGILGNQAALYASGGENVSVIETGSDNVSVSAALYNAASGITRLVFRYVDANNYIMLEPVSAGFKCYKRVAGGWNEITSFDIPHNDGEVIKITLKGSSITFYQNGVQVAAATETFNQNATKHGIGFSSGSPVQVGRIDNFLVS